MSPKHQNWVPSSVAVRHRMRRWVFLGGLFLAVLVALLLMVVAADARADERIVAGARDRYATPSVTIDQGERLTFQNLDVSDHDVMARQSGADGKPLFKTPLIGTNEEAFVEGSQYLTTGAYQFFCSIHTNMEGTLTVGSAGTPVTRPAPDTTPPGLGVGIRTANLANVLRTGKLPVRASVDEAADATFKATIRRSGRTVKIATGSRDFDSAGRASFSLRLTAAGRRALRAVRRAAVTLSGRAVDAAENVSTAKATRTLKR